MEVPGNTFQTKQHCGKLLIRPELSPSQGIASLAKCLLLARSWPDANQVGFVLSSAAPRLAEKRISDCGFDCLQLPSASCVSEELAQLKNCIAKWQPSALILDGRHFAKLQPSLLSTLPTQVVCLQHPEIALRPEFHIQDCNDEPNSDKKIANRVRRITVIVHGSDERQVAETILMALDKLDVHPLSIDVCVTPINCRMLQLQELASVHRHSVRVHKSVSSIEAVISRSDLGIVNFGPGCFELAYHGVPMLAVKSNEAPDDLLRCLTDADAISVTDFDVDELVLDRAISSLARDRERRRQLSRSAKRLVDGNGARRIAEFLTQNPTSLTSLRRAS